MRGRLIASAGLGAALLLMAGGCGGSKQRAVSVPSTTLATTTAPTTTALSRPLAVPAGFVPLSFTAISESDYWVLGSVPCTGGRCTAIARTTDGGATFSGIHAPELEK